MLIIAAGAYGWWYIRQANAPGDIGGPVEFVIAEGEDLDALSARLEDEGIVENAGFFENYVADHGGLDRDPRLLPPADRAITSATFSLACAHLLRRRSSRSPSRKASRCARSPIAWPSELPQFSVDEFMAAANDPAIPATFRPGGTTSMEGLLFPATYRVSNADSERQVVDAHGRTDGARRRPGGNRSWPDGGRC